MVVFDDFPAEKAEELMHLAGSGNAAAAGPNALGQPSLTGTNARRPPRHTRARARTHTNPWYCSHARGELTAFVRCCARLFRHAHRQEGVAQEVPREEEEQDHRRRSVPGGGRND